MFITEPNYLLYFPIISKKNKIIHHYDARQKDDCYLQSIQKVYSLTNIVRAFQSKLRNSKNHFGVDTRYVNVYSCPYKTSFPDHP